MPSLARIAITGGEGLIGSLLSEGLSDRFEIRPLSREDADVTDLPALERAFAGAAGVVHLAASAEVESPWDEVLPANLIGAYNAFEAARRAGAERVVLASSNHAVGMYARDPERFAGANGPIELPVDVPFRPDSIYGASKAWGETIGRFFAERHGLRVVCLRIGWVTDDDRPATMPPSAGGEEADRARRGAGMWLSHRDCVSLVAAALTAEVGYATVHGVSDNADRWFSLDEGAELLGWRPRDGAR